MNMYLEILVKAYVELSVLWSRTTPGENCARLWKSIQFLEKLIRKELEK